MMCFTMQVSAGGTFDTNGNDVTIANSIGNGGVGGFTKAGAGILTLNAAHKMDTVGNKVAKAEIAMIKVVAPRMACQVIDWALQIHGGGGVSGDFPLALMYAHSRTLRLADGPDEVHRISVARRALRRYQPFEAPSEHIPTRRAAVLNRYPGASARH